MVATNPREIFDGKFPAMRPEKKEKAKMKIRWQLRAVKFGIRIQSFSNDESGISKTDLTCFGREATELCRALDTIGKHEVHVESSTRNQKRGVKSISRIS